ncbi:(2,3-dihydroxybenzoyl)adenylate synthase [Natrialbaceae archaeon A-gly3]
MQLPSTEIEGYVPFPDDRAESYIEEGYWNEQPFHAVLDERAERHPDRTALIGPDRELSYAELAANSERIAAYLQHETRLQRLDRVVFQLPNTVEFIEAFFACSRLGVVPVMLLPRHRESEARHVIELTDAKAFATTGSRYDLGFDYVEFVNKFADEYSDLERLVAVAGEDQQLPKNWTEFDTLRTAYEPDDLSPVDVNPSDPGVMLLSGGTTGLPKGIPRTHNDYVFQWEQMAEVVGVEDDWVGFPSVPIGHNASLCCVVGSAFWAGATVAVEPVLKPDQLMQLIEDVDGTYSLPVPTQLVDILEHPDRESYNLSSLEVLISGGQKVPPRVVYELVDEYGIGFCNIFGMAEGPLICTRPDDDVDTQANTVGRPIAPEADEVKIVSKDRRAEVDQGEQGELSVQGPGYFTGYFRTPEENAENFDDDGWFYTEDVLSVDDDGNYRVHGRIKETIIRGGENIYAPDLEDVLIEHEAIENVAVIGMPDERLGERPAAFVELRGDASELTLDELQTYLGDRGIAVFKRPERLEIVDELPRTEVGKIAKTDLKEQITEKLEREGQLPEEY